MQFKKTALRDLMIMTYYLDSEINRLVNPLSYSGAGCSLWNIYLEEMSLLCNNCSSLNRNIFRNHKKFKRSTKTLIEI